MKRIVWSLLFMLVSVGSVTAEWALLQLDELVKDTDLVVIGTLHSASEDYEGIGQGYILIEEILPRRAMQHTSSGEALKPGDNLRLAWADNWACAAGMHMGWQGEKGIWLLNIQSDGSVRAGYPGRFVDVADRTEIERLLRRVKPKRTVAVETQANLGNSEDVGSHEMRVDVTPFREYHAFRAAVVLLLCGCLYWLLYKSRFSIR